MRYCIGVDMGGTATKIGLFTEEGTLLSKTEIPTRVVLGLDTMFTDIAESVKELCAQNNISLEDCAVGMGVAGPVDRNGYVEGLVNLNMCLLRKAPCSAKQKSLPV